jgi:hypothetical protein
LTGPARGGTTVTIAGKNLGLPPGFACLLPCPARVTFGGTPAELLTESQTALIVKTPPHVPGSVDVVVVTGDSRTVTAASAFVYDDDQEASFERLLLPIYLEGSGRGSNGSQWQTQLWYRNNGPDALTLAPWTCPKGALCVPVFPLTRTLQPGETALNLPVVEAPNPGRLLYVNRDGSSSLSASLRLYEVSHKDADAGTDIPVVRESELLTSASHFHSVPLNGHFRISVRVYELGGDDARFRVRVFEEGEGVIDGQPLTEVELRATSPETGTFRMHPGYAEFSTLTDLLRLPMPLPAAVRVDVEPLTQGSRYWAFVSVTNNDTQRVTLVTPR